MPNRKKSKRRRIPRRLSFWLWLLRRRLRPGKPSPVVWPIPRRHFHFHIPDDATVTDWPIHGKDQDETEVEDIPSFYTNTTHHRLRCGHQESTIYR